MVSSVFSIVVLLIFCYLLIRRAKFDPVLMLALVFKILSGICLGLIYKFHYHGGDTFQYFKEAGTIANYFTDHPGSFIKIYFDTNMVPELLELIIYNAQPRALLFSKIVSVIYLFTGGNYWISSVFFSLISFMGIYFLVNELTLKYNNIKWAIIISFYFLPSFVFWSSGLLKESIAIASLFSAVAIVLRFIRTKYYNGVLPWIGLVLSIWLLWEIKYYYAAVAVPLLAILLLYDNTKAFGKWNLVVMGIVFFALIILITNLHYNLNPTRVLAILFENYQDGISSGAGGAIEYYFFDGSLYGFLLNFPVALFGGLFRPMIYEANNLFQVISAIENTAVLLFLLLGLRRIKVQIIINNPVVIILLVYIISLATMMAFSSPNFGTLARYKVGYWPFFGLLVLFLANKKARNSMSLA